MRARRRHLRELCVRVHDSVERCRDEYLASLDPDDALAVLQISREEILSAAAARLPAKRRRRQA